MRTYTADRIHNVGLFSHAGAGKTTLAEAMLYETGAVNRMGRVDDGTTVSDYEAEEIEHNISIHMSLIPIEWNDYKINVIDTPGYSEFQAEAFAAMRAVDSALIVVDAASGVEVGTTQVWEMADHHNLARMVFVNRMNREHADFHGTLTALRDAFGKQVAPIQFPIGAAENFRGIVDLLTGEALLMHENGDGGYDRAPIPEELAEEVDTYRRALIESIAEHNEELLMRYLDEEPIDDEEIIRELHSCVEDGTVVPLLCGSADGSHGVSPLIEAIVRHLPSADERVEIATRGEDEVQLKASADETTVGLVFKSISDPHVGRVSLVRVFSGAINAHDTLVNPRSGGKERIGKPFTLRGKTQIEMESIPAGDIGALTKLGDVQTGDTLVSDEQGPMLRPMESMEPTMALAVNAESKSDVDKLAVALERMVAEDAGIRVRRDEATGETLILGQGEQHINLAAERLMKRSGITISLTTPRVAYRETITRPTRAEYKHKKQTGGAGQYGHVVLEVKPSEDEFAFDEQVVGGAVPKGFFPAVEKGVRDGLESGSVAGFPVVNVHAILVDGSYHSVDSNEMAFRIAAKECIRRALEQGSPVLLEPIHRLEVTVPDELMGDVLGHLNSKRGQVLGVDAVRQGWSQIIAEVPLAEVQRYSTELRSMSQGRATFTMSFARYQQVPESIAETVRKEAEDAKAA
ncbi:MAG: elongation factor G [Chloroflexota bacterium]|nr:elongation factor G [Chloroflexota bacterium]